MQLFFSNPFYFAPEIISPPKRYHNGPKVDVWAAGLIILELLTVIHKVQLYSNHVKMYHVKIFMLKGSRIVENHDQKTLSLFLTNLLAFVQTGTFKI